MKKIIVGLSVPAIQEHFDLLVPVNMDILELRRLLVDGVSELCNGRYHSSHLEFLTLKDPDILLQPGKTLESYGAEDGTQLVLF